MADLDLAELVEVLAEVLVEVVEVSGGSTTYQCWKFAEVIGGNTSRSTTEVLWKYQRMN